MIMGSFMMACLGTMVGIWADKWDQQQGIDNFIVFLENLSLISDFGDIKEIIKNINTLSNKLSNVESFKKAKKEYTTERKNIQRLI